MSNLQAQNLITLITQVWTTMTISTDITIPESMLTPEPNGETAPTPEPNGETAPTPEPNGISAQTPEPNGETAHINGKVKLPLQLRIEQALNKADGFQEELARYGFNSVAELEGLRDFTDLYQSVKAKVGDRSDALPTYEFYKKVQKRKQLAEQVTKDAIVSKDPVSQALRHVRPAPLPQAVEAELLSEPIRYAKPESIQSSQSAAAYLKHIYDLAQSKISPIQSAFALDVRRPDLRNLELSEDNLHQEITTLELVNEVLQSQLLSAVSGSTAESLFTSFKTKLHPLALPFNKELATVRTGLAQIPDMSINQVARRIPADNYALTQGNFTLVPHPTDALNLIQSEVNALKQNTNDNSNLITQVFGANATVETLQYVDTFIAATDISFDELRQLLRDYPVKDEAGTSYHTGQRGTRFYATQGMSLVEDNGRLRMKFNNGSVPAETLGAMNHIVRLYKRTGLAFHELDQLLCSVPGGRNNTKVTDGGFNILAHCLYWREQYNLSVDQFVGLLSEINYWVRVGEDKQPNLMRQLFGDDAPRITTTVKAGTTKLNDLDAGATNGITLGDILRRGLKLSRSEWNALVNLVKVDANTVLNQDTLSRLYRLATIFPLLGWDVLSAIELVRKIDVALLTTLTRESTNIVTALLPAIDKLVWLSQWMNAAEFSVTDLLMVLTSPTEAVLQTTQEVTNWLNELNTAIEANLLNSESDFAVYREWRGASSNTVTISDWFVKLQTKNILDAKGLVKAVTKAQITTAVTEILTAAGATAPANDELKAQLIDFIAQSQYNQEQVLCEQVIKIAVDGNPDLVPSLLRWLNKDTYNALSTLLSSNESNRLQLLYDVGRHLNLISKLSLSALTIDLLCDRPVWLATGMTTPVSLKQVYYLERFRQIQNAEATTENWLAYFNARWAATDLSSDRVNELLAFLLDWNKEDINLLRGGTPANTAKTVQEVEFLSRQIQLCQDLYLSATELLSLSQQGVNSGTNHATAAAAVLAGINRSSDENLVPLAQNAQNEAIRDALVAAYLSEVVANDEALKDFITDEESLYTYLLLDVNVSSAVPTSRMVEATSSVQLYINRMLQGIEPANFTNKSALDNEWETAKQYRVWEANEKLKLYPSNYIEPELRYKKTEPFKQFEQSLSQGALDENMIETALSSYMLEIQHLTELQPTGFCQFRTSAQYIDYYFTAQAGWAHMTYYYRHLRIEVDALRAQNRQAIQWGEWKSINLPAVNQQVFGICPAFGWNRLFLMWIELEEQRSDDGNTTTYYLRPKYMRQGVDGSFGEPWEPSIAEEVLRLLRSTTPLTPTLYQANYENGNLRLLFTVGQNKFIFEINQSEATVYTTTKILSSPPSIEGYSSTKSVFSATDDFRDYYILPSRATGPDISDVNGYIHAGEFEVEVQTEMNPLKPTLVLSTFWALCDSISGLRATLEIYNNGVKIDEPQITLFKLEGLGIYNTYESLPVIVELDLSGVGTITTKVRFKRTEHTDRWGEIVLYDVTSTTEPSFEYSIATGGATSDYLFRETAGTRKKEAYLIVTDVTEENSRHAIHLVSPALGKVPELLPLPDNLRSLFSLSNQRYSETGVNNFLVKAEGNAELSPILQPKPKNIFDFDGPMGLYGWEIFYHIPAFVAAKYADNGNYDAAEQWMKCIYNPSAQGNPWGVVPLVNVNSNSGTFSITDPDYEGLKNPIHYQHATIRQHLEHLQSEGDDSYRKAQQDTLPPAKMCYVEAKALFNEEFAQQLNVLTASDWSNPTLGQVSSTHFRPPYNQELQQFYQTFEQRLHNLRHWLDIEGEPLNIPLLAAPINPKELQASAIAAMGSKNTGSFSVSPLPYTFEKMLSKTQSYTKELMNYAGKLQTALEKLDDRTIQEIRQVHEEALFDFTIQTQEESLRIAQSAKQALIFARNVLTTDRNQQLTLAAEFMNFHESMRFTLLPIKKSHNIAANGFSSTEAFLEMIPNIYGFAFGGGKKGAAANASKDAFKVAGDMVKDDMDAHKDKGSFHRRQQTEMYKFRVLEQKVLEIDFKLSKEGEADHKIEMERLKLKELRQKRENSKFYIEYNERRFTNAQFYDWYIGEISHLYRAAYDATIRFAKMAEKAFQAEVGGADSFIGSYWDSKTKGLMAPHALWLDLQRMELDYFSRYKPSTLIVKELSLKSLDPVYLESLKVRGETVFCLNEELFEADYPGLYGRRIQGIRVSFPALANKGIAPCGQLTQIDNRLHLSRDRNGGESIFNPYSHQTLILGGWQTDSSQLSLPEGYLKPFQNTGVDSTWHLSFPAAVKAFREKRIAFPQKEMLQLLNDVVIEVTYSAQM